MVSLTISTLVQYASAVGEGERGCAKPAALETETAPPSLESSAEVRKIKNMYFQEVCRLNSNGRSRSWGGHGGVRVAPMHHVRGPPRHPPPNTPDVATAAPARRQSNTNETS